VRRRGFLGGIAAAAVSVAGCLDAGDTGEEPTGDPTTEPTDTPAGRTFEDTAFEVTNVECGSDYGHHDVTKSGDTVTVEGVLEGRDGCYTAELARGEYSSDEDTLFVEVESSRGDDGDMCTQCIVEVHYTATFEFDDGTPNRVEVDHRTVTG
jgi:hypothetical protein